MEEEKDLYELLSLKFLPSTSREEIKAAYRKRAKVLHPDKNRDDPDAAEKFQELNKAFEILYDEEKRKQYDQNCKAKLQKKKQLAEMDEELRKRKLDLERKENEAKKRKVGIRSPRELEKLREQHILQENIQRQQRAEEDEWNRFKQMQEKIKISRDKKMAPTPQKEGKLLVDWSNPHHQGPYSSSHLISLFSRWGTVSDVEMKTKKKMALLIMREMNVEALDALVVKMSNVDKSPPFSVQWVERPAVEKKKGKEKEPPSEEEAQKHHESFEERILRRMREQQTQQQPNPQSAN
mmetsp:Transcript_29845/g.41226  ORF Transcript_29845/g.41226 Transcript_29845/m.41226 type:complete len:294 (+) Transcript_29845:84-965(+)